MEAPRHSLTIGARVNEAQMAKIDAAACLTREARAHFIARAALGEAERTLRDAVDEALGDEPTTVAATDLSSLDHDPGPVADSVSSSGSASVQSTPSIAGAHDLAARGGD